MPLIPKPSEVLISLDKYLLHLSSKLGGDILPLNPIQNNIKHLVSERAIDYELMRSMVQKIALHNGVFYPKQTLSAYPTLDALGNLRGALIKQHGDVQQIALLDKIGGLTVSIFKLKPLEPLRAQNKSPDKPKKVTGKNVYRFR